MIKTGNILIKNIYYMLCYAFKNLESITQINAGSEDFENIQDLFSVILYKGVSHQLKRGLNREYEEKQEQLVTVRGKININETIKTNSLSKKKLICEFDEFSENSYFNKVLKSTCLLLLRKGKIKQDNRKLLKKILIYFCEIDAIDLKRVEWTKISYHRNNVTYRMLINICYLVVKGLLMTTVRGELVLNQYLDDRQMHSLYEKFVLEYYKCHYPELQPKKIDIDWNIEGDKTGIEFLPNMQTDITLMSKEKTLIIDTKFYSHSISMHFDKISYLSNNLYQIFTYVKNKDVDNTGNIEGMLLYAKTEDEILTEENTFNMSGNSVGIRVLDLNQDWGKIKEKLDNIANELIKNNGEINISS